jgi:DNA-binding NarL/FixJ family response regulator
VDDFAPWRNYLVEKLSENPAWHIVGLASDGFEAVLKASELRPDLILMDVNLPKLSGLAAARRIRRLFPESKILFLSQDPDPYVVRAALGAGGLGYLVKFDAESELFSAMEAVLLGKTFVSGQLASHDFTGSWGAQHNGLASVAGSLPGNTRFTHRHEVAFYDNDVTFLDRCARFLGIALAAGDAVIVIATLAHRNGLRQRLESNGWDVLEEIKRGRYLALEAADVLSACMVHDRLDPDRFIQAAIDLIEVALQAATGEHPRVAVCGECAALLCADGRADAAIRLEQLWNELAGKYDIDSLCGFPIESFGREEKNQMFERICAEHSAVYSQ